MRPDPAPPPRRIDYGIHETQRRGPAYSSTGIGRGGTDSEIRAGKANSMKPVLLVMLAFYRRWISPGLHALSPGGCRFAPTCSEYASEAIATHGAMRGMALAAWRLLRCNPFSHGGFDPVPPPAPHKSSNSSHYHRKSGAC